MGCDIHGYAERRNAAGQWEEIPGLRPFDWRSYNLFGWLAGVRNYSAVAPIAERRGLPGDVSPAIEELYVEDADCHSATWVSLAELREFDYDMLCEDRRGAVREGGVIVSGAGTCPPGKGAVMPYREFLGKSYFDELDRLQAAGAKRVIVWFDN